MKYMNKAIKSAVLLICFNRPNTTQIVFDSIRRVRPGKLYIAIDGPRNNRPDERHLCTEVLGITQKVDWECNVEYLIRSKNVGCKLGVTTAITWALKNEDRIIIIEDDIVAPPAFYYFADEMLEKYRNEEKISIVSGNNYTPLEGCKSDYLFSKYGHIWGWATWKRVWEPFDVELPELESDMTNGYLKELGLKTYELKYFSKLSKKIKTLIQNGQINTWDYQFVYYRIRNNLMSIIPKVNLASNIGINSSRTDYKSKSNTNYYPAVPDFVARKHPEKVECNLIYDQYHFKKYINKRPSFIKLLLVKAFKNFH